MFLSPFAMLKSKFRQQEVLMGNKLRKLFIFLILLVYIKRFRIQNHFFSEVTLVFSPAKKWTYFWSWLSRIEQTASAEANLVKVKIDIALY